MNHYSENLTAWGFGSGGLQSCCCAAGQHSWSQILPKKRQHLIISLFFTPLPFFYVGYYQKILNFMLLVAVQIFIIFKSCNVKHFLLLLRITVPL
jgi:hypothetical protein